MAETFDITSGVAQGTLGKRMSGAQIVDACSAGIPIKTIVNPNSEVSLNFANWGDAAYRILLNTDCTLSISGGNTGEFQKITIFIQQPYAGNCSLTLPANVKWVNAPFVDTRINAVTILEILYDGSLRYYGRMLYG